MRAQVAWLGCMPQVSLDLSAKRMADLAESGVDILELLGQSFQSIVDFYRRIEGGLVPRTMKALSGVRPCAISLRPPEILISLADWNSLYISAGSPRHRSSCIGILHITDKHV